MSENIKVVKKTGIKKTAVAEGGEKKKTGTKKTAVAEGGEKKKAVSKKKAVANAVVANAVVANAVVANAVVANAVVANAVVANASPVIANKTAANAAIASAVANAVASAVESAIVGANAVGANANAVGANAVGANVGANADEMDADEDEDEDEADAYEVDTNAVETNEVCPSEIGAGADTMNFILIDGSYFVFYRYFALNVWWKNAKSGDKPDTSCNEDPAFIEKFKKTFESRIAEMDDCLGLHSSIKLAAIDCKRADIWRNHLYPAYKLTRTKDDEFGVSKFFALTYEEKLFEAAGVDALLMYQHLEADDCIAITTMHLRKTYPEAHIWIIANDHDYLQLHDDHVHLRNLKYQDLTQSKSASGDPVQDLFCKIVAGDKSDNIRSIFKKCGIKTAQKYYNDQELFYKALIAEPHSEDMYCLNQTLVDFNYIPSDLVEGFRKECLLLPD
jgi:5'-3' exonuclease